MTPKWMDAGSGKRGRDCGNTAEPETQLQGWSATSERRRNSSTTSHGRTNLSPSTIERLAAERGEK